MARISSIVFDKHGQLKRATVITAQGTVKVTWLNMDGDHCWFSSGLLEARRLAVEAIQRIERMADVP